jgi:hypothetical protein
VKLNVWYSWFNEYYLSDELKKKLKFDENKEKDVFFIEFEDYVKKFRSTTICATNWKNLSKQAGLERFQLNHEFAHEANEDSSFELQLATSTVCFKLQVES